MNKQQMKDIRGFLGKTQHEFAAWLGVSPSLIGNIEAGNKTASPRVLSKLASKFDVSNEDFKAYCRRVRDLEKEFDK